MKRTQKITGLVVGLLLTIWAFHGLKAAGRPQAVPPRADAPTKSKSMAVGIVRTINTAQVSCRARDGKVEENYSFLSWDELLSSHCFDAAQDWFSQHYRFRLAAGPEIAPGLELRLVVSGDGRHYNLSLVGEDSPSCRFGFFSDEGGVIYEGKSLGCDEIPW